MIGIPKLAAAVIALAFASQASAALTLLIGTDNTLAPGSTHGLVIVGADNYLHGTNSVVVGYMNMFGQASSSLMTGSYNMSLAGPSQNLFVTGSYNSVLGSNSITGGSNNTNYADNSMMVGYGNVATGTHFDNALVAGKYNAAVGKNAFLVIGNGASSSIRRNAFVVYQDGDVYIRKSQGDVPMGIFTN